MTKFEQKQSDEAQPGQRRPARQSCCLITISTGHQLGSGAVDVFAPGSRQSLDFCLYLAEWWKAVTCSSNDGGDMARHGWLRALAAVAAGLAGTAGGTPATAT